MGRFNKGYRNERAFEGKLLMEKMQADRVERMRRIKRGWWKNLIEDTKKAFKYLWDKKWL